MCCAVLSRSVMSNSATPWTLACQAALSMGILQARILEWVAIFYSNHTLYYDGNNQKKLNKRKKRERETEKADLLSQENKITSHSNYMHTCITTSVPYT